MAQSIRRRFTFRGESRTPVTLAARSKEAGSHQVCRVTGSSTPNCFHDDTRPTSDRPSYLTLSAPATNSAPLRFSTDVNLNNLRPVLDVDAIARRVSNNPDVDVLPDVPAHTHTTRRFSLPARYASPEMTGRHSTRPESLQASRIPQAGTRDYVRFNPHKSGRHKCATFTHRKSEPVGMHTSKNENSSGPHVPQTTTRGSSHMPARTRCRKSDRLWWALRSTSHAPRSSSSSPSISQPRPSSFFGSQFRGDSRYSSPQFQTRASANPQARSSRMSLSKFARPFGKVRALWPFHSSHSASRSQRGRQSVPATTDVDDSSQPPPVRSRPSSCRVRRSVWPRRHSRPSDTEPLARPCVRVDQVPDPVSREMGQHTQVLSTSTQMNDRRTDDPSLCPITSTSPSDYLISTLDDRPQANPLRRLSFHAGRTRARTQSPRSERASEPDRRAPPQPRFPSLPSANGIANTCAKRAAPCVPTPDDNKTSVEIGNSVNAFAATTGDSCAQTQEKDSGTLLNLQHDDLDIPSPPSLHSSSETVTQSSTFSLTNSQSLSLSLSRQSSLLDALLGSQPRLSRRALRRHDLAMRMRMATAFYQTNMGYANGEYYHSPLINLDPVVKHNPSSVMQQLRSPGTPHGIPWSPPPRLQPQAAQHHVCLWPAPTVTLPAATTNAVPIPMPIGIGIPTNAGMLSQGLTRVQTPAERPRAYLEGCEWSETSTEYSETRTREKRINRDLVEDGSCDQENFLASRIFAHKPGNSNSQFDSLPRVNGGSPPVAILPPAIAPMPTSPPPLSSDAPSDSASVAPSRSMDDIFHDAICNVAAPNRPIP